MADVKNTASHPVALPGGRVLAPGETGDADLGDAQVAAEVQQGFLTEVQSTPADQPDQPATASEPDPAKPKTRPSRTERKPEES